MLLSIIITYYNESLDMLQACVDSALKCSSALKDEVEVIVVDDGSAVSAQNEAWMQTDRVVYVRQQNAGLSSARNTGLAHACGEYIQFLDADDMLLPQFASLITMLREEKPDVLMFDCVRSEIARKASSEEKPRVLLRSSGTDYMQKHNLRAAACMYTFRKEVLGDLRFHDGIYHEDELFTPQLMLRADRVVLTDAAAYYYCVRQNSITTAALTERVEKRLDDILFVIEYLRALNESALQRRVAQLTMDYVYNMHTLDGRDKGKTRQRIKYLKQKGYLPLPLKAYTWKYFVFALITRMIR